MYVCRSQVVRSTCMTCTRYMIDDCTNEYIHVMYVSRNPRGTHQDLAK